MGIRHILKRPFLVLFLTVFVAGCNTKTASNKDYQVAADNADFLHDCISQLTDVIVNDIFSPPVASRVYAYPSLAAYEVLAQGHREQYQSLSGQLNDFKGVPKPDDGREICLPLAACKAFLSVGRTLVFTEYKMSDYEETFYPRFKKIGVPQTVYDASLAYGEQVAQAILSYAKTDGYDLSRTFQGYSIKEKEGEWVPTPPDYMDPIEPNWSKLRPFVLDSATQYVPVRPTEYNMDKSSDFYKEVLEVYKVGKNLTEEEEEIASFWDCNPFISHHVGHMMYGTKKISPGAHWIGIATVATRKIKADLMQTAEAYAFTAITIADAFISCWDEKYRSNLIRPETVINAHIDNEWKPILQTPPFPEYTSGHSVVSASAATTLTHLFGDQFSYLDTVEVGYGLPARSYRSFREAAEEAAISRLYGGIHYMPAIENGVEQGKKVGTFVVANVQTKRE